MSLNIDIIKLLLLILHINIIIIITINVKKIVHSTNEIDTKHKCI